MSLPYLPPRPPREYRPGDVNAGMLRRCRQNLDAAPDDWTALAAAFDWFRYAASRCEDNAAARAEVARFKDELIRAAERMGGTDDHTE